jgi:WhiB family redox-sensing transcriptional regulator
VSVYDTSDLVSGRVYTDTGSSSTAEVLLGLLERPAWHARALCRGGDPDVWFPHDGRALPAAAAVCAACPVAAECAVAGASEDYGVWSGTSARSRVNARREANRKPRPVLADGDRRHGTEYAYLTYRCRCDLCREAASEAGRRRYHQRKQGAAS